MKRVWSPSLRRHALWRLIEVTLGIYNQSLLRGMRVPKKSYIIQYSQAVVTIVPSGLCWGLILLRFTDSFHFVSSLHTNHEFLFKLCTMWDHLTQFLLFDMSKCLKGSEAFWWAVLKCVCRLVLQSRLWVWDESREVCTCCFYTLGGHCVCGCDRVGHVLCWSILFS